MEKFVWSDEYSVGISAMDEDHKNFFSIANNLIDLLGNEKASRENLIATMRQIGDYAASHFAEEEAHFDRENYRDAPRHISAHDLFRRRVDHYMRALDEPNADIHQLANEIATFSIYWLSDHILLMDKQYTIFLRAQNADAPRSQTEPQP